MRLEYIKVLESTMIGSGIGTELPLVGAIGRRLPFATTRRMFNANQYLLDYGSKAVENAKSIDHRASVFRTTMQESEKEAGSLDDLDVRIEAANLIVAGTDTTSVTLTYATWLVLQRPQLRRQLEEEIESLPDDFTDEHLETLPWLSATLEETLRLYGAAPGSLPRRVPEEGASFCGFQIPGGITVSTQSWTVHRNSHMYPDAER